MAAGDGPPKCKPFAKRIEGMLGCSDRGITNAPQLGASLEEEAQVALSWLDQ